MQEQHNISATGGNEKTQYYFGLGYFNEKGLLKSDDIEYKRFNLRSNITTELAKNLKGELLISGLVWYSRYVYLVEYLQYLLKGWKGTSTHFAQGNFRYVSHRVLGEF